MSKPTVVVVNRAEVRAALAGFVDAVVELETDGMESAAGPIADDARGRVSGVQGARVAPYLRVEAGKPPRLVWSGSNVVVSGSGTVSDLVGGVEYGGPSFFPRGGHRFNAPNTPGGRFLHPAVRDGTSDVVRALGADIVKAWNRAARRSR